MKPLKRRGYLHDPQVLAVYRFERQWRHWNERVKPITYCRKIVRKACELYGVPSPVVTEFEDGQLPKDNLSYFDPETNRIMLLRHHHNDAVALHEAAHAIMWHKFGHHRIDHGPTWLGIYMWLMTAHQVAPQSALEAAMTEHGLEWTPIKESHPARVGKALL